MIFSDGLHDFATAFRVDDPARSGFKQWVCGCCVEENAATDPGKMAGQHKCEQCGNQFGMATAYERADELLARICPVAERQRTQRLAPKTTLDADATA